MKRLLVKSKKILLLVLSLCVLVTCKSDIVFASDGEGDAQIELVYNLKTSSFNIGNDTDGNGVVDDFGDTDKEGRLIPSTMYNDWTDQTATKFIPFYETAITDAGGDDVKSDTNASSNGYVWARGKEGTWRFYPCKANNQQYVTTYDYQNRKNTMPWQWTSYKAGLDEGQSFMTQNALQVRVKAGDTSWSDGSEPYFTIKLKVPASGIYNVTTENSKLANASLYFYMLPVTTEVPTKEQLMNEANLLGSMDTRENTSVTLIKKIEISDPGEYYLTVKIDDDNWKEGETRPSGNWDINFRSIKLKSVTTEVNGMGYATLQEAISAATKGDTITLLDDIEYNEVLTIGNGITFDLNGKKLTASNVATFGGNVVDSSGDKAGRLKVDAENGTLSATNSQIPIYIAGEGYMFATMLGQSSVTKTEDSFTVISRPSFGDAYSKLAGGADAVKLQFIIRLDWGTVTDGKYQYYQEFKYNEDTVKAVYNVDTPKAFSVTVNGLSEYKDTMKVTVLVRSTDLEVEWVNNEFYMSSANR